MIEIIDFKDNQKPIYKFGKGDIDIFCFKKKERVYLGFKNDIEKEINKNVKSNYKSVIELVNDCDGFMSFSNIKSIDVVINQLEELKFLIKSNHEEILEKGYTESNE